MAVLRITNLMNELTSISVKSQSGKLEARHLRRKASCVVDESEVLPNTYTLAARGYIKIENLGG